MARQLNLDRDKLDHCYELSAQIVSHASKYWERHSTPAIERATLILLGVDGDFRGTPLASLLVEKLTKDQLRLGAAYWWGRVLLTAKEEAGKIAEKLARGKMKWTELPEVSPSEVRKKTLKLAEECFDKLSTARKGTPTLELGQRFGSPLLSIKVEVDKPKKLRPLTESLLQKGIRLSVAKLHSKEFYKETWQSGDLQFGWTNIKEFKPVVVTSGLSCPEQTLLALQLGFGAVVSDGWTPILKGEIDAKRSLVDHSFALGLCAKWPVKILSDHGDLSLKPESLLASLLLYEQMARRQNIPFENIMLSTSPFNGGESKPLFASLALAQVLREMFSQSPLWYRLSDKMEPFHFLIASLTEQNVIELNVHEESVLKQAQQWFRQTEGLGDEITLNTHGKIGREAHLILDQTWKVLRQIHQLTLWKALEENILTTHPASSKSLGAEGVFQKSYHYWNPVWQGLASS